jgi:hypothetical protein
MINMGGSLIAPLLALVALSKSSDAFYLPGVNPQSFKEGDV